MRCKYYKGKATIDMDSTGLTSATLVVARPATL